MEKRELKKIEQRHLPISIQREQNYFIIEYSKYLNEYKSSKTSTGNVVYDKVNHR